MNKFKFEVSFNLKLKDGEKLDKESIKLFERDLFDFVKSCGYVGCFYAYASDYDVEVIPKNVKVKKIKA